MASRVVPILVSLQSVQSLPKGHCSIISPLVHIKRRAFLPQGARLPAERVRVDRQEWSNRLQKEVKRFPEAPQ